MYKKLSIIIPAYNEKGTILEILKKVDEVVLDLEKEIIIVDDCSTDGSREILESLDDKKYKVILKKKNGGKGSALKAGIRQATGEIVIFQDADLEYDPKDYPAMLKPILEGRTELALGVRMKILRDIRRRRLVYWLSWLGNNIITWTTNILYLNNAGEYEGCYKAVTKKLLDSIEIKTDNFDFDNELVCKALKAGEKTVDVPIHYYPRGYEHGKKINWKHGFLILWTTVKCRFSKS